MAQGAVFGRLLGRALRSDPAPVLINRTLRKSDIAITECRADAPETGPSGALPSEDAFMISLKLKDYPGCEYWYDGRRSGKADVFAGATYIYDLKHDPRYIIDKPYHSIYFYVPAHALESVSEQSTGRRASQLYYPIGEGLDDPVFRNLGMSLLQAVRRPDEANQLFVDHVSLAIVAHAISTYGRIGPRRTVIKGGLAQWQLNRVCDQIDANLAGTVTLAALAASCGLSASHFTRSFRHSTGYSPHQWLLHRRVETAKALLQVPALSLSDIATRTGFTDQSHFTRVFKAITGHSPGLWRRSMPAPGRSAEGQAHYPPG